MWFLLSLYFALWTSVSTLIVKKLTKSINPIAIILIVDLFVLPFMFLIILLQGGLPEVSLKFYFLMFASSILDTIASLASIFAIAISPISLISPISSFNPVFTTIIAIFTLHEVPSLTKLLGILLVVAGSYFLNIADVKQGIFAPFQKLFSNRGVQLFLLANLLWGITPSFQKLAIFETSPRLPLFPSFFGLILVTIFIAPFALKKTKKAFGSVKKNLGWFLLIGPLGALGQLAAFTAFSQANVGYVTAIFKLSVLFTILLGWLVFKEERIKERLLGAIVMLAGTILLIL